MTDLTHLHDTIPDDVRDRIHDYATKHDALGAPDRIERVDDGYHAIWCAGGHRVKVGLTDRAAEGPELSAQLDITFERAADRLATKRDEDQ